MRALSSNSSTAKTKQKKMLYMSPCIIYKKKERELGVVVHAGTQMRKAEESSVKTSLDYIARLCLKKKIN
jgi:hypothetical protein